MNSKDPLDRKIDELLASQPAKAPDDFAARTLAKVEAEPERKKPGTLAPLIRFALPLAAAIALAFIVFNQFAQDKTAAPLQVADNPTVPQSNGLASTGTDTGEALKSYEIQELLLLQEGLSGFAHVESVGLSSGDLLDTLDTLYSI